MNSAILGFGIVGSGVYEAITKNQEIIKKRVGEEIKITRILDLKELENPHLEKIRTQNIDEILNDPSIDVVAEMLGGINPAYDFCKLALQKGKSVVTSNKAIVAEFGPELLDLARANKCSFLFEASVGGGIPIISPILESLVANNLTEITGILNGTTNFMLSKMQAEKLSFSSALRLAQEFGYAEADVTADVSGMDTCRKIAILVSIATGKMIDYKNIDVTGILALTDIDVKCATILDSSIKLLAMSKLQNNKVEIEIAPMFVKNSHVLATVNEVKNAVFIKGDIIDEAMFVGPGAGKLPTASAVISDIVACSKNKEISHKYVWTKNIQKVTQINQKAMFFVRVSKQVENNLADNIKDLLIKSFEKLEFIELPAEFNAIGFIIEASSRKMIEKDFSNIHKELVDYITIFKIYS